MLVGCGKSDPGSAKSSPRQGSVVEGNTAFATDIYQRLTNQPGNLCFSPYGISSSLAMTYAGARGQTEQEIAKTMHFRLPQQDLHPTFRTLGASIQSAHHAGIEVALANSLWCQQNQPLNDAFITLLQREYGAGPRLVDFKDTSASAEEINAWFRQKTKGRIKNLVDPSQTTGDTRLMLCNAVYFKGEWATRFDRRATSPTPFYVGPEQIVTVPMMRAESKFKIAHASNLDLLELPYAGHTFSMIVLLPADYNGLPGLEQQFTMDNLKAWLQKLKSAGVQKTHILMPRLKITQSFNLSRTLTTMGMPSLFSETDSDLSGMSRTNDLFVSDVVHEATIEVNEEGTEAAAATAVRVRTKSQPPSFRADHPFLYLIIENRTGSMLFLGRVVDPSKAQ
jgi:serpin B